jgi:hypothetical protein
MCLWVADISCVRIQELYREVLAIPPSPGFWVAQAAGPHDARSGLLLKVGWGGKKYIVKAIIFHDV